MREWSPRRAGRDSVAFRESYGEVMLPMEVSMPTLRIIKPLKRNEMEYVFSELAFNASIVMVSLMHYTALQRVGQLIFPVAC